MTYLHIIQKKAGPVIKQIVVASLFVALVACVNIEFLSGNGEADPPEDDLYVRGGNDDTPELPFTPMPYLPTGSQQEPEEVKEPWSADLLQKEAVEDSFFLDAAFLGNSLVEGLSAYGGLSEASYFASDSMTVFGVESMRTVTLADGESVTIIDAVGRREFGKIYMLFGINEIGYDAQSFIYVYGELVDKVKEIHPDADIYVMSLTPISAEKSATDSVYNMEKVLEFNRHIYDMCMEKEAYYVDMCQALSDASGFLPEEVATDGVHFVPEYYSTWRDYLKTHYA